MYEETMYEEEYQNIQDLVVDLTRELAKDFYNTNVRYRCAGLIEETYEFIDSNKHPALANYLYERSYNLEMWAYPLEPDNPKYKADILAFKEHIQETVNNLQEFKKTLYKEILTNEYTGDDNRLKSLVDFYEQAIEFDLTNVKNRYLCSAELWAFLPEVDSSSNMALYRFVEDTAEALDKKPLPSDDPYYKNEIEDYRNMLNYTIIYLKAAL